MPTETLTIDCIIRDPEIRGGRTVVRGTTLRISDIAVYHVEQGMSPEELADQFNLGLWKVHAALSYYFSHQAQIDAEIRQGTAEAEMWRTKLIDKGAGDAIA